MPWLVRAVVLADRTFANDGGDLRGGKVRPWIVLQEGCLSLVVKRLARDSRPAGGRRRCEATNAARNIAFSVSAHKSIAALTADLNEWIAAWNTDPKPLVWHKTADQIVDSLKKF